MHKIEEEIFQGESSKTLNELSEIMDEHVNAIHELNDHRLRSQGIDVIPFYLSDKNAPTTLFLGSFTAQKTRHRNFWFCIPCDVIAFRKQIFATIIHVEATSRI